MNYGTFTGFARKQDQTRRRIKDGFVGWPPGVYAAGLGARSGETNFVEESRKTCPIIFLPKNKLPLVVFQLVKKKKRKKRKYEETGSRWQGAKKKRNKVRVAVGIKASFMP